MIDCVFCRIIWGQEPAVLIQLWDDAIAIAPLNPVTPGHILVLPIAHVADFGEDPAVSTMVMGRVAELVHAARGGGGSCNVITSVGEAATQTVPHLHVHLVPRRRGDGLALPWTSQS